MPITKTVTLLSVLLFLGGSLGCAGDDRTPIAPDGGADSGEDTGLSPLPGLKGDAPAAYTLVYEAESFLDPGDRSERIWIPYDVTAGPRGEAWIIQRVQRKPGFDDVTECTERGIQNRDPSDDDCFSLLGSTVTIVDPANPEPASSANRRSTLVADYNGWHFMRRPSSIAFGAPTATVTPDSPGAQDRDGTPLISEPMTYEFPFANCIDARTGNYTDEAPFVGPSLWTSDPALYNGANGSNEWSNGSHLDMAHGTKYCTGIAWERDAVFWAINGDEDAIDRYDFGQPHLAGHWYHEDASITRYSWVGDGPSRVEGVPSNAMVDGRTLYVADSGNGRVISMDLDAVGSPGPSWFSFEGLECDRINDVPLGVVADTAALAEAWGGDVVPSGLAIFDDETLVVANNASGHISLIARDGTIIRTLDTGTGAGIGGLTVIDGTIYFVHTTERRLYRIDVDDDV